MRKSKGTINSYSELQLIKQDLKRKVKNQEENLLTSYLLASKIFQFVKASKKDKKNKTNKEVYKVLYPYIDELTTKIIEWKNKNQNQKDIINNVLPIVISIFTTDLISRKINNLFNKKDKSKN